MSLFAIGDLHLSFSSEKPMDVFGEVWRDHPLKIKKYWEKRVRNTDTVVITGDHSWGNKLSECMADLEFIEELPGKKVLLRGNHDRFWEAKKTRKLNDIFQGRLFFLQNNYYTYGDYALIGTKGRAFEGRESLEHFIMIRERELIRLQTSYDSAYEAGYRKFIMFLHYPPTSIGEAYSPFTRFAEEHNVSEVVYSHCHGEARYNDSFLGLVNNVNYRLVSSDYLRFRPERIL